MESTVVVGLIGLLIFVLLLIMGMSIAGSMTLVGFFGFAIHLQVHDTGA